MKNLNAQRLAAATALALLTAGVPAMAERSNLVSKTVGENVPASSSIGLIELAQVEPVQPNEVDAGTIEELKKRQRERQEAQQQRKQERQQQRQEAQQQRQEAQQQRQEAQQQRQKPAQAAEPAQPAEPATPAKPADNQPAQRAEPAKPAEPAVENPVRAERQKQREERQKQRQEAQQQRKEAQQQRKDAAKKPGQSADPGVPDQPTQPVTETTQPPKPDGLPYENAEPATPKQPAADDSTRAERQKLREERRKQRLEAQQQNAGKKPAATQDPGKPDAGPGQPVDQKDPERAGGAVPVFPGSDTPVLDSQKEPEKSGKGDQAARPTTPPKPAGPPPKSDKDAQEETIKAEDVKPVTEERGTRVEGDRRPRRERREGSDVLREIDGRIIINLGGRPVVESSDRPRMARDAREVYYEELPRGRVRETIVRPNGVQIVTVRDRYGEVIRRSRIMPDGREYVLAYYDGDRLDGRRNDGRWRDPGDDLPPLVLTIPVDQYILDAEDADNEEDYYDFLDQPPVERVERLYSVDEVKRSARVRDTVRRVDLDTITFEFGSAEIKEDAIQRLDNVAKAMEKMLQQNPAETFLIEGHTDAVGSDMANLALSDRRAEAVAAALTDVFEIPPENLTTQGYGEQYLKIKTDGPDERNRRVAIRRITPLITPVASAQ